MLPKLPLFGPICQKVSRRKGTREAFGLILSAAPVHATSGDDIALEVLRILWSMPIFLQEMQKVVDVFLGIITLDSVGELQFQTEDQDFGPIRTTSSSQMIGRAMFDASRENASKTCISISLGFIATQAYYAEGGKNPVRVRSVIKAVLDGTGTHLATVGPHVLDLMASKHLDLSPSELDSLLDRIGSELLPSYEYARSSELLSFILRFLTVTANTWGREHIMELAFVNNARRLSGWFSAQLRLRNMASWRLRKDFGALLDLFVTGDLSASSWAHDEEEEACENGVHIGPVKLIASLLSDTDFRTRYYASRTFGHACSHVQEMRMDDRMKFWEDLAVTAAFDNSGAAYEKNATLVLAYGNAMIASSYFRPHAYQSVIVHAALDSTRSVSLYIQSTLSAVAQRLGLSGADALYTLLAPYTMAEQLIGRREAIVIPDPTAFGFASKRELYEASFDDVAGMVLAGPRQVNM